MRVNKWIVASAYIVAIIAIFMNVENLTKWMDEEENDSFLIVFLLVVLLAAVPGIPFGLVGAVIGAKYGVIWGSLLNLAASTMAAVMLYFIFRYLLLNMGLMMLKRYDSLRRTDEFIKYHTFWALLIARIIPIVPAALINLYAGVFGLPFRIFLFSTLLGKIPVMFVFAYMGDHLSSGSGKWVAVVVIYALFLLVVYGFYQLIMGRRR